MLLVSPYWVPVAVFLGGILSPILGWARAYLNQKNAAKVSGVATTKPKLDRTRLLASSIIAAVAALIFLGQYSGATAVGIPDLQLAFVAGFGSDKIVKNAIGV